jgi:polysaccharide pyruvyl transferase WcaK-like protein
MREKSAVILNFTAGSYHWGCYGTAMEVYESLLERGYFVSWVPVEMTHALQPSPETIASYDDAEFHKTFLTLNHDLLLAFQQADVVVINGEGTLHRLHAGPRNLLYLAYLAKRYLGKRVHLLNGSFFPSGSVEADPQAETLYGGVARLLDRVTPREVRSRAVLERLGVACEQGFDCLPRFIARLRLTRSPAAKDGPILLAGGVTFRGEDCERLGRALAEALPSDRPVRFLTGAKRAPAREDQPAFEALRAHLPGLELRCAGAMGEWLDEIASAACMISARFHHSLAAIALQTPVIAFPSNTPKIEASFEMLGLEPPLTLQRADLAGALRARLAPALAGEGGVASRDAIERIVQLADANFAGL